MSGNVEIKKNEFLKALQKSSKIITAKPPLPVLSNVLLDFKEDTLRILTTDLEKSICVRINSSVKKEGKICFPAKRLLSFVREMPGEEILLEIDENFQGILRSQNCEFKILGQNPDEFPEFPEIKEALTFELDTHSLEKAIKLVSYAVSSEESKYVLNGILFEFEDSELKLIATDGRRLALSKIPLKTEITEKISFIAPSETVDVLEDFISEKINIKICFSENKILFDLDNIQIISRSLEGEFPDYKQVIPDPWPSRLKINRDIFLASLKRANLLTTLDYQAVQLDIKEDRLIVKKQTPEIGEMQESLEAKFSGKPLSISFNPVYLIEPLKNLKDSELEIEIRDSEKPAVIRKEDFLYIVLPIRMV